MKPPLAGGRGAIPSLLEDRAGGARGAERQNGSRQDLSWSAPQTECRHSRHVSDNRHSSQLRRPDPGGLRRGGRAVGPSAHRRTVAH